MKINKFIHKGYFSSSIREVDSEIENILNKELERQKTHIELIASENIVSNAVLEAMGSIFTNKTVEGYPGKRYFSGVQFADQLENLAIDRAKKLFNCKHVNVQPHSGSQANHAVYAALLKPGDRILSMDLSAGGHLSHGAKPNLSSKIYNFYNYGLEEKTSLLDYEELKEVALKYNPKLIIAGGSSYSRIIDFKRIKNIAKEIGAYLLVDMAHFSGLVATGYYPDPLKYADICTTTTYKSLRGPRGGIIITNNTDISKKVDAAIFPGIQGTPMLQTIAAKAVCFLECLKPEFTIYNKGVLDNANILSSTLMHNNFEIVSGGTDTGLMVVDLRSIGIKGNHASEILDQVGLTCNKNSVLNDPEPPMITSGIRISSNAGTTRGLGIEQFKIIGEVISDMLKNAHNTKLLKSKTITNKNIISELCLNFKIYGDQ